MGAKKIARDSNGLLETFTTCVDEATITKELFFCKKIVPCENTQVHADIGTAHHPGERIFKRMRSHIIAAKRFRVAFEKR